MKRCTKKIKGLGDPYEGSTREISWSPLRYGKNKLGSLPTPTESHRRRIRMKEIEGAHPACRIILATLILTTILIYSMQSTLLPVVLYNNIDQKVRNFIWASSQEKKKVHLARWEIVTNTKENRGLGIQSTRNINIAFMAKLGWRLITVTKDLEAHVCKENT